MGKSEQAAKAVEVQEQAAKDAAQIAANQNPASEDELNFERADDDEQDFDDFLQLDEDGKSLIGRFKGEYQKETDGGKVVEGLLFEKVDGTRYLVPKYARLVNYFGKTEAVHAGQIYRVTRTSKREIQGGKSFINFTIEKAR